MSEADLINVMKDALVTTMAMAAPFLVVSVGIGIVISVIQAATQIHEQNVGFVFKILAIGAVLILMSSWLIARAVDFTSRIFAHISSL